MHWGWLAIGLGILVILTRGPLIFLPRETLGFYRRLFATDSQTRAWSILYLLLALLCGWAAMPVGGTAQTVLGSFALVFLGFGLWALAMPTEFRGRVDGLLAFFQQSVDSAVLRGVGVLAVGIGGVLIYVGARAL